MLASCSTTFCHLSIKLFSSRTLRILHSDAVSDHLRWGHYRNTITARAAHASTLATRHFTCAQRNTRRAIVTRTAAGAASCLRFALLRCAAPTLPL